MTALHQSGHIRQFLVEGRSGNITDAQREALRKRREELRQCPGSFTEAPDRTNATHVLNRSKLSWSLPADRSTAMNPSSVVTRRLIPESGTGPLMHP